MVEQRIPEEFDIIQTRRGYTMKGWDFTRTEIAEALRGDRMLNPAYELASNACPWNCFFCFTEDPDNPIGKKGRLRDEMSLEERLKLINESKGLGARTINLIGAGEPTVDPNFWGVINHIYSSDMTPIVYTEGALRLRNKDFVSRLYDSGATVVLKVNSLKNEDYQNRVVSGGTSRSREVGINYFNARNEALERLIEQRFNESDPTRLAFDTIVCRENLEEIPNLHRYARDNNIFTLLVNYLPSGRSSNAPQNAISGDEQFALFDELARIDKEEYEIEHRAIFPYAGGVPCSIRGLGLYIKIKGAAYDCPGESEPLGNYRAEGLKALWDKADHIREGFDGGCLPRELYWKSHSL